MGSNPTSTFFIKLIMKNIFNFNKSFIFILTLFTLISFRSNVILKLNIKDNLFLNYNKNLYNIQRRYFVSPIFPILKENTKTVIMSTIGVLSTAGLFTIGNDVYQNKKNKELIERHHKENLKLKKEEIFINNIKDSYEKCQLAENKNKMELASLKDSVSIFNSKTNQIKLN